MRRNEISAVIRWRGFLLKTRENGFARRARKKKEGVRTENTEGTEKEKRRVRTENTEGTEKDENVEDMAD